MTLTQVLPTVTETPSSSSSSFTCIACQMAFSSSGNQRAHYRTDWHKYNLKRKMADLEPVTSYQFNEKVLAQQAKVQEEFDQNGIIYHCDTCRKSYGSQLSYESHLRSKKHKEGGKREDTFPQHDSTTGELMEAGNIDHQNAASRCLFCDEQQYDFDANLRHMSRYHGFFLPDAEYLSDVEGLVNYLSNKIRCGHTCLYCSKGFKSSQATMAHMTDKGHCKMAYDDTEDPEALLKYYDFGTDTSDTEAASETKNGELQLQSGIRLSNRHFLKSYKRQHHRSTAEEQPQVDDKEAGDQEEASDSDLSLVVSTQQDQPESLAKNRKERRHPHLTITDGQVEQQKSMTLGGIHEAALKHAYQSNIGVKQNSINTFRFRTQNPI